MEENRLQRAQRGARVGTSYGRTRAGRAHRDRLHVSAACLRNRRLRGGRPQRPARARRCRAGREGDRRQRAVAAAAPRAHRDDRTRRARRLRPRGPDPRQARRRRRPAAARVRHLRGARRGVHPFARRGAVTASRRDAAHRSLSADTASGECACGGLPPGRARDRDDGYRPRPARRGRHLPVRARCASCLTVRLPCLPVVGASSRSSVRSESQQDRLDRAVGSTIGSCFRPSG